MPTEIPLAVREAIRIAPIDPQYDGPKDDVVSKYVNKTVNTWKQANQNFCDDFTRLEAQLDLTDQKGSEALRFYLATAAITLAGFYDYPQSEKSKIEEAKAGITLFENLIDKDTESEQEAFLRTQDTIFQRRTLDIPLDLPEEESEASEEEGIDLVDKLKGIKSELNTQFDQWIADGFVPEMRDVLALYKDIKKRKPVESKYLFDLTIGDIRLRSNNIEPEFADLPERLGFEGRKLDRIRQRRDEYHTILLRALENTNNSIFGYQTEPVGWNGLIQRGEEYLRYFGLEGYQPKGKFIAMGGSDAMDQSLKAARAVLRGERTKKYHRVSHFNPQVLFPTPGFMMMKDVAEECGMKAVELVTNPQDHFLPDPDMLRETLKRNKKVKIVVLTPINNPGSHIAEVERMQKIINVLNEEEFKDIIVINDLAYLGSGDMESNQALGQVLNQRPRRIDILAWTKLIGRPGLRCATGATPDPEIAKVIVPRAKKKLLAVSYAMQAEAMAIHDFVKFSDIEQLMKLYRFRQDRFINLLRKRPDIFDIDNAPVESWDAALYAFIPIRKDLNPLKVISKTGLFGTPVGAFYFNRPVSTLPNYMRFALGVTPMTEENIRRMLYMMNEVSDPEDLPIASS